MTATRDRQSDLDEPPADPGWDQRPIFGYSRGLPWWAAVLLAFGLASIGAWVDFQRQDSLGRIYQAGYVLGCVVAVCWVRRRNLFGPMVQPPLVFAVTAVGAVVIGLPGAPFSGGMRQLILSVALPLTSNFPTMAITTGVTLAIGLFRLFRQRDPNPRIRSSRRDGYDRDRDRARPGEPDLLDDREVRATRLAEPSPPPPPRQARDRRRPDRGGRPSRARADQEPPPAREPRKRTGRGDGAERGERGDRRNPPPRSGRGRGEPPAERDRERERDRGRGDRGRSGADRERRRDQGGQTPPRRQPRRRPPDSDGDYR